MPIQFITKSLYKTIDSRKTNKANLLGKIVHSYMLLKANQSFLHIKPHIRKSDKILDVGLGAGTFAALLKKHKYNIKGVDVVNISLYSNIQPDIYNGKKLPYKDNQFDVALLVSVLHHCGRKKENLSVLKETMRVAKKVIVIEDSYRNELERKIVSAIDQTANWEFWRHPYLTNSQWFSFINKNKWQTIFAKQYSQFAFGMIYTYYCMYVIKE